MIRIGKLEVEQGHFPDNTLLTKFDPYGMYDRHGNQIIFEWLYEDDSELFTLICLKKHIDQYFPTACMILDMPYIPHARMDRTKSNHDVFTLKYFCEVINSLNFRIVWVRDAHSNVSLALLDRVKEEGAGEWIGHAIANSGANALFFPDEGAMKRYSDKAILPYAFGMKKRDWETGKILGLDIINTENIVGKHVLIVDDICSRGGTFYHSAKALKEAGAASVELYVTHLEKTVLDGELPHSDLIDHIYTTESIFPATLEKENEDFITVMR